MNKTFYADGHDRHRSLISSIRVETHGVHSTLHIWNRGGKSGHIVVNATDAGAIVDRLLPREYRTVGLEDGEDNA